MLSNITILNAIAADQPVAKESSLLWAKDLILNEATIASVNPPEHRRRAWFGMPDPQSTLLATTPPTPLQIFLLYDRSVVDPFNSFNLLKV